MKSRGMKKLLIFALAVMTVVYVGLIIKRAVKWNHFWSKATSCEQLKEAEINMTKLNNVKRFSVGNKNTFIVKL